MFLFRDRLHHRIHVEWIIEAILAQSQANQHADQEADLEALVYSASHRFAVIAAQLFPNLCRSLVISKFFLFNF